jgi:site-specific DNA-cytosine methylase
VLETEVEEKYYLKNPLAGFNGMDLNSKSNTLRIGGGASQSDKHNFDLIKIDKKGTIKNNQDKASTFTAGGHSGGNHSDMDLIIVASRGRNPENPSDRTTGASLEQRLEPRTDGKTNTLTSVQKDNMVMQRQLIIHNIPEIVSVRKHEVDILALQKTLKEHKKTTNQQIADALNVPKTMVEHWFRTDACFSIPDKDLWIKLKEILGITTDEFDESIMTFEERESVFEKTNRVYDENGIAPTLTSTSADERILVRDVKQLNPSKESNGAQPYQQNRVYSPDGISPALSAQLSSGSHLIQVGNIYDNEHNSVAGRVYTDEGKSVTLSALGGGGGAKTGLYNIEHRIRRLTEKECCRLQTVDDNYFIKDGKPIISSTQQYRCLGNGWTVDVIAYIFSFINHPSAQSTTPT